MRTHYEISRHDGPTCFSMETRYQSGAARNELWKAVYEMLDANGLRDRPVAYRLLEEVNAAEVSPPPKGCYRSQYFRLGYPYLDCVSLFIFRAERL